MKGMKNIFLIDLPPPVEEALREHLARLQDVSLHTAPGISGETEADLVIAGAALAVPGVPVMTLSFARLLRLGELLGQIGRMIAEPVLYIGDIDLGGAVFSPQDKVLSRGDGVEAALTDREVDILVYLARRGGAPVSREALLKNVWKYQEGVDTHTLETHIYRLRQKLEVSAEAPKRLVTTEGGYCLQLSTGA